MGKKQHQKDKLYLTTTEWKNSFGGHKGKSGDASTSASFRRLPFDHCCLSLLPFSHPVCSLDGHIFDLVALVPYLKRHGVNPVTGKKLDAKSLITLHIHKNAAGEYHCPATFKPFTNNSHIVCITTTGNVFSSDAVEQLNVKAKYWKDLLTDEPFTKGDIITLQDPLNIEKFNIASFHHVKMNQKAVSTDSKDVSILRNVGHEAKEALAQLDRDYKPSAIQLNAPRSEEMADNVNAAHYSTGAVAAGFTSTVMDSVTTHEAAIVNEDILRYERVKKKAYVRVVTNLGPLNLELHADMIDISCPRLIKLHESGATVPKTCENFVKLCQKGYYNDTIFHRSIKHFMVQGGDPTGTGAGGESCWGTPFEDEFKPNLSHAGRGILSMANSGTNTNKSQFFITFRSCTHLDNKHSVFGKLVGGMDTLHAIERVETDDKDKPKETIAILTTQVFVDPYAEADEQLAEERRQAKLLAAEKRRKESEDLKKRTAAKILDESESTTKTGVGKYLKRPAASSAVESSAKAENTVGSFSKKSKASKRGLSDFSAW